MWSFSRPGLRTHGMLLEKVAEMEATPPDLACDDFNRFIYWLAVISKEIDDDFIRVLFNTLAVFRSYARCTFSLGASRNGFIRSLRFCAQLHLIYESLPETAANEHNLLGWHENWDRPAMLSYPPSNPPPFPLPPISSSRGWNPRRVSPLACPTYVYGRFVSR